MSRTALIVGLLAVASVSLAATEDAHFIQPDDYFIGKHELGQQAYMYVKLAKMITAPSGSTKGDGEFLQVSDGKTTWTNHIWRSRIAAADELKLGLHIIAFHDSTDGVYQAPAEKEDARGRSWWYAKITDLTDTYKGYVTVSGNYKVGLKNIRIPIPYSASEAPVSVAPMPAPPAPPPTLLRPLVDTGRVSLYIQFDQNQASIRAESLGIIDQIAQTMKGDPAMRIAVEGHTDATGDRRKAMLLSRLRAKAVMEALVARGIEESRLSSAGYGPDRPVADNATPEGQARNRRVELVRQ